ncbi:hypothetical protein TSUD_218820 [Trifolium subterraneum]|uniref:Protein kinase domain-containing protein n=1 Tax=Trifolium subterraneum TaxID=3900 RepID=A0A2Z6MKK7_TRISU|nr:hypothetical protein TSUD_218820 [Trifolium subterraneum]
MYARSRNSKFLLPCSSCYYDYEKGTTFEGCGNRVLSIPGTGLSIGLATILVVILFMCYWRFKSSEVKNKSRTNHYGLSRNTTIPESGAVYFGIPVFSYDELKEATNNFDQARQIGEGGFGTIYYGKLRDGREVAVKRLFERNYRPVESFTNEIQILTRMRHRNLVSLYGCTSRHSQLAFQCLQDEKELRPSMSEVLEVLQRIESDKNEGENHEGVDFHLGVEVVQSYAHPSLPNTWMKPHRHRQTL